MSWLFRVALRFVPESWRDAVRVDLEEEARLTGRSGARAELWCAWQALRLAMPLQGTLNGDVLMSDLRHALRSLLRAPV